MNNASMNRFTINPTSLDMKRSRFSRPFEHTTTFDAGKLIPFYCEEVLPGDTVSLDTAFLVRAATPLHPVMDTAFVDVHYFFVPNRLIWEHWEQFMGENKTGPWVQPPIYQVPQLSLGLYCGTLSGKISASYGADVGSVMDYLGIPVGIGASTLADSPTVNALPFRAYAKIWNDWYRSENIQDPININLGDSLECGDNGGLAPSGSPYDYAHYCDTGYITGGYRGAAPLPVCKLFDFFTASLPFPQRGPDVLLPLGDTAPVKDGSGEDPFAFNLYASNGVLNNSNHTLGVNKGPVKQFDDSKADSDFLPANTYLSLQADLSNATAATINTIRWAFQLQKYYERLALGGMRYNEQIQSFFGVHVPDERVQRSEFLGGRRVPLNMTQVAQTSDSSATSTPGKLGAFSQTADNHSYFTKSFVEHGYLFGMIFVRTARTYQQGLNKMWSRKDLLDFYNPVFANVGNMPVLNKEIYLQNESVVDSDGKVVNDKVFGYQEAWAEYRYSPNRVSGEFRSALTASLDSWHYADKYTSLPTLSPGWIREPQETVARTQVVQNEVQFIADIQVDSHWTRVMPLYSVPGLVDHH